MQVILWGKQPWNIIFLLTAHRDALEGYKAQGETSSKVA